MSSMVKALALTLLLFSPAAALAQDYIGITAGLADANRRSTPAEIHIDERLADFMWQRRPLADGSVEYHNTLALGVCVFVARPPWLTTSPESDIEAIRKEAERQFAGRDLAGNQFHDMRDGSTVVSMTVANGRGQSADLYILFSRGDHGVVPFITAPMQQAQLFIYRQAQTICQRDHTAERTVLSLWRRPGR